MEEKWNKETKNEQIISRTVAENFYIRTVHLDNNKVLFIHQLIHQ